jgi:oxygen-independent coproporphyrinogen-3 oxidase
MSDWTQDVGITLELLRRYDRPGPRYTSYPTAVEFHEGYGQAEYREKLTQADTLADEPLSLYLHLPFCEERCTYCGCNVVITRKREVAEHYLGYLHREIDLLAEALPHRRRVTQYHWGGGTPTYLSVEQMAALHRKVSSHFEIDPEGESAIEIDPRVTTHEQIDLLKELGFNRLSMGVQDFTPEVQAAVNRHQSEEQTRDLIDHARKQGMDSINLDLIYGLPLQTPESFSRTMEIVRDIRPARLAIYSYAFVPWLKAHQKRIEPEDLPSPEVKLQLFCIARAALLDAGYAPVGMDHFALPEDELVQAIEQRRLHRSFMGYTVKMGGDTVAVGTSAIGDVQASFAQNTKKLPVYYAAIDDGRFPTERGYILSEDDRIRREVITRLMCNFHVEKAEIERRFSIDFDQYFAAELLELQSAEGFVAAGFAHIDADAIDVLEPGRLFVRNVCMLFDQHLEPRASSGTTFSRTI